MKDEIDYMENLFGHVSIAEAKRRKVYTSKYNEGFDFRTNCDKKELGERIKELEKEGFEVFIGDSAWFGKDILESAPPEYKTILVRKK